MTFEAHLAGFSQADWATAADTLAPEIHPIDIDATRLWLAFFPIDVPAALAGAMGKWRLADHIDSSHTFFYGHRYWPQTKRAILAMAAEDSRPAALAGIITKIADHASRTSSVDRDQLIGIAIAGLMSLRQCGSGPFSAGEGTVQFPMKVEARSIRQVLRRRRFQRSQGLLGFLRGSRNRFQITFDENSPKASFDLMAGDDIAARTPAGASLIGVLAGAERLSPVDAATEGKELQALGCAGIRGVSGAPIIRLAKHVRPQGDATFVVPFI